LADFIDDYHPTQPTVFEMQKFNFSFGQKNPQIIKKQALMNFIGIGDKSSRHQAAIWRCFGV
jgi:hypothetical protein